MPPVRAGQPGTGLPSCQRKGVDITGAVPDDHSRLAPEGGDVGRGQGDGMAGVRQVCVQTSTKARTLTSRKARTAAPTSTTIGDGTPARRPRLWSRAPATL